MLRVTTSHPLPNQIGSFIYSVLCAVPTSCLRSCKGLREERRRLRWAADAKQRDLILQQFVAAEATGRVNARFPLRDSAVAGATFERFGGVVKIRYAIDRVL
jgi:hypothetical protein